MKTEITLDKVEAAIVSLPNARDESVRRVYLCSRCSRMFPVNTSIDMDRVVAHVEKCTSNGFL